MSLKHGRHNEELFLALFEEGVYRDWVITVAFYTAIHYVEERLFPTRFYNAEVHSLEEAHERIPVNRRFSRHTTRGQLVQSRLPKSYQSYDKLRKQSQNARYVDYQISDQLYKKSKEWLTNIKNVCEIE
ncbi:MAG: hypothetical protein KKD31_06215 [Bacteroidetes bacterium]|nr:hypothetical protein [Bacteroidota bacterium]